MADETVPAARVVDVGGETRSVDGSVELALVTEEHVLGEGAGEHSGRLGDVGDLAGAEEELRLAHLSSVPRERAGVVHEPRECRQQARLAGAHGSQEQHELALPDGEIHAFDADRPVIVQGGEVTQRQFAQGLPRRLGYLRCRTGGQVEAGREVDEIGPAGEFARRPEPGPRSGRLGDDRPGDPAEPVEVGRRVDDEQRRRKAPGAVQRPRPGCHDACLHHERRDAVEHGGDSVLAHRGLDARAVDGGEVFADAPGATRELDGARCFERGDEGATELGTGRRRPRGGAARHAPSEGGGQRRADHDDEQDETREPGATEHSGENDDDETVGEVDPPVGIADEAI